MFDINFLHIPKGIRLISWATAIRFVGWGVVEIFIPVFLLSFAQNFTETGFLKSIYDIVFLLSLPIISRLADRISGKKIILSGLILYPIISLCYFFAGVYGAVIFIIIARVVNGLSYALDSVGKKTYIRRHSHEHAGLMFGYFDTLANFWWLVAAVAGLFLMKIFPFHQLFLLIIPTTLIAMVFISKIPHEPKDGKGIQGKQGIPGLQANFFKEIYRDYAGMISFIHKWTWKQKYVALLYALMGSIFIIFSFFIPLVSFANHHDYFLIFLLTSFAVLPYIFGVPLGMLADRSDKHSLRTAMLMGIVLLALVPFIETLWITLGVVFVAGLCVYYSMLVLERSATDHESRAHMGSLSGAFLSMFQMAQIASPIVIGFLIDFRSLEFAILAVCLVGALVVLPLFFKGVRLSF